MVTTRGGGRDRVLPAPGEWRPGMPLNILPGTRQPTTKKYLAQGLLATHLVEHFTLDLGVGSLSLVWGRQFTFFFFF